MDLIKTNNTSRFQRILLSQDRHQVYLTVATYGSEYVNYLKGTSRESESRPERSPMSKSKIKSNIKFKSKFETKSETKSDREKEKAKQSERFMTMNEFGPWDISRSSDIEDIASIILALTWKAGSGN